MDQTLGNGPTQSMPPEIANDPALRRAWEQGYHDGRTGQTEYLVMPYRDDARMRAAYDLGQQAGEALRKAAPPAPAAPLAAQEQPTPSPRATVPAWVPLTIGGVVVLGLVGTVVAVLRGRGSSERLEESHRQQREFWIQEGRRLAFEEQEERAAGRR